MKLTAYLADRAAALLFFELDEGIAAGLLWLFGVRAVFIGFVAAVFGVFADEAPAQAAKAALLRVYPQCWVLRPEAKGARVVGRG